jgi:hypothetical protein
MFQYEKLGREKDNIFSPNNKDHKLTKVFDVNGLIPASSGPDFTNCGEHTLLPDAVDS